jgi:hypothetical protein
MKETSGISGIWLFSALRTPKYGQVVGVEIAPSEYEFRRVIFAPDESTPSNPNYPNYLRFSNWLVVNCE